MSSNPLRLKLLLQKYLNNTCSPDELTEFWQLMNELSENDLISVDLQDLWDDKDENHNAAKEVDWDKLYGRLQEKKIDLTNFSYTPSIPKRTIIKRWAIAASILICVAATLFLYKSSTMQKPILANAKRNDSSIRHRIMTLPDGSTVTLHAGSKLEFADNFKKGTRDVYLNGEAFFDVKHIEGKPFLVHTGDIVTKVLGTAFNVKAYPDQLQVFVTVARGKVQVGNDKSEKPLGVLLPGDQLSVDRNTMAATTSKADIKKVIEWKTEALIFDDITFGEAVQVMSSYYGKDVQLKNEKLANCKFTGDFSSKSIEESLDIICTLTSSSWKAAEDSTIVIDGKGCE